jgi:hypothetical protein
MDAKTSIYLAIGTLILGWFLAIIGNVINEKLKRKSTKSDIIIGINSELSELQIHLTAVCLTSASLIGQFTKEFFLWVKPYFIKFFESAEFIIPKEIRDKIPNVTEINDDVLFELINATLAKKSPAKTTSFTYQNVTTPYMDFKISDVSLLKPQIQKSLFTLKRDINFLNSDVNQICFYHSKTFDNPTQGNLELINANLDNLYARIYRRSKIMIENIEGVLKELK